MVETIIFILVLAIGAAGVMTLYSNVMRSGADALLRHKGLVLAQDLMDEILGKRWDQRTPNGGGVLDACGDGSRDGRNDSGVSGNGVNCDPGCDGDDASPVGLDAGEAASGPRRGWNDIDDYDGLVEDNANGTDADDLQNPDGTLVVGAAGFRRRAAVAYVCVASGEGTAARPYEFAPAGDGRGGQDPDNSCGGVSPRTNYKRITVVVTTPAGEEIKLVSIRGNY